MGAIDRYGNFGVEYKWVTSYFKKKDAYWDDAQLGKNMIKSLRSFLNDSGVTVKNHFSPFGEIVDRLGIETSSAWALMLCELAYTSEFNWWIMNIDFETELTPDGIYAMLTDVPSENSRSHIVSAYKNILVSNSILSREIGLGECDWTEKNGKRFWNSVIRTAWKNPDPVVILYSMYKFAEACGDYYTFTLSRLTVRFAVFLGGFRGIAVTVV